MRRVVQAGGSLGGADGDDDVADLLAGLDVLVGLDDLLERIEHAEDVRTVGGVLLDHQPIFRNLHRVPRADVGLLGKGEERERLWKQMAEIYPPYLEYQDRAGERTIPVVVLDPVG